MYTCIARCIYLHMWAMAINIASLMLYTYTQPKVFM